MKYIHSKEFARMISKLNMRGGQYQNAARQVRDVLGLISINSPNPFSRLSMTNHGEKRIKHCWKYDLPAFCRLITVQTDNLCFLLFVGDHDQSDEWVDKNRGFEPVLKLNSNEFIPAYVSEDIEI